MTDVSLEIYNNIGMESFASETFKMEEVSFLSTRFVQSALSSSTSSLTSFLLVFTFSGARRPN